MAADCAIARTTFSIPKADRWAAAVAWLATSTYVPHNFQYPQSGSMGCSLEGELQPALAVGAFSIPKADRWAAAKRCQLFYLMLLTLSVSPKRIDGLQQRGGALGSIRQGAFQYPQSGSMGCSVSSGAGPWTHTEGLSVSPKRIDGLQPGWR